MNELVNKVEKLWGIGTLPLLRQRMYYVKPILESLRGSHKWGNAGMVRNLV